jgi:hypothetical protein
VAGGVRGLGVDDPGEGLGDPVEPLVVGEQQAVDRLQRGDARLLERGPEGVVALGGAERVDEQRVEPRAATLAGERAGAGRATALLPVDLGGLGEAEDPAAERDLLALEAVRVAAAVPVLVEVADRGLGLDAEADRAGDLGAALAAQLGQAARPGGAPWPAVSAPARSSARGGAATGRRRGGRWSCGRA